MAHVHVLGLILALALGLVALAVAARVPKRDSPPDVTWLPTTLLLYNLWIATFLATGYLQDEVLTAPPGAGLGDAAGLALLALSLAWLFSLVAQVFALLGAEPPAGLRRAARAVPVAVAVVLAGSWLVSRFTGNDLIFQVPAAAIRIGVFPAAIVAAVWLFRGAGRFPDAAWRSRLSSLAVAYIMLFSGLLVLTLGWGRLAGISPGLPVTIDLILEVLYNVVAIVWLMRLTTWIEPTRAVPAALLAMQGRDRAGLLRECGVTKREAEIVELICLGKTNQEIADQLFIAVATVKDHNYVIFQKLAVRNRTELASLVLGVPDGQPK